MSDIGIRLDGLILAAAIALTTLIYMVIFAVSLIMAVCSEQHRSLRMRLAKLALVHGAIGLACLVAVIAFIDHRTAPLPPTDWIDWLAVPWIVLFCFGALRLIRCRDSLRNKS